MAVVSREEAVRRLEEGHRHIADLTETLTEDEWTRAGTIGDGDWSAKDLLGHIASWEEMAIGAIEDWRAGRKPRVEEEVFASDEAVDRVNAENVERKRGMSLAAVRSQAKETHATVVEEIARMRDEEWTSKAFYRAQRRRHLGELLGSILGAPRQPFGHAFAHLPDLEGYVGSRGMAR